MDPQSNYIPNQPPAHMTPVKLPVSKPKNRGKKVLLCLAVLALAGLAYTILLLTQANKKINHLSSEATKLDGLSGQLDQLAKTTANDKVLGSDKIDKSVYQAVFMTDKQVYFGKLTKMTAQSLTLEDVFSLKVSPTASPNNDLSLAKPGCDVHKPQQTMDIARTNVLFWENLKDKDAGGVPKAIADFHTQNPDPKTC